MSIEMANLRGQYAAIKDEVAAAISQVLDTCRFILGEQVDNLEREIAAGNGARFGVAVASGTDAITIALKAMGIGCGDEVITTPFTFVATTEAIVQAGATPVYADVDPETLNVSPEDVERRITSNTKALLPVHLYGQCADMEAIERIARRNALRVVADAAQAIGAERDGRRIGEMGEAATLSFFPTKNLGAYGDGGMILTNDEQLAAKARSLRFHGMVSGSYYYEDIGYCSRLDELQAAILRVKLRCLETWNERRRRHAARYMEILADAPLQLVKAEAGSKHTFHQFTIRHPQRDELRERLRAEGIASMVYYPLPLHLQPAYRYLQYREGDFPEAELAAKQALSIPVHPELRDDEAEFVGETLKSLTMELASR